MSLSRINTYKGKKKTQRKADFAKYKVSKTGIKQFFFVSSIAGVAFFSTSIAYAEFGISDYLKKWYQDRVQEAEIFLTTSTENEVNNQKANLLRQIREQTIKSVSELQEYAISKQEAINNNILEKVNETVDIIESQNQEDIDAAKKEIDEQTDAELITEKNTEEPGIPVDAEKKEDSETPDEIEKGEESSPDGPENNDDSKLPEEAGNKLKLPEEKQANKVIPKKDSKDLPINQN